MIKRIRAFPLEFLDDDENVTVKILVSLPINCHLDTLQTPANFNETNRTVTLEIFKVIQV